MPVPTDPMRPPRRKTLLFFASATGLGICALGGAAWHFTRPSVQRDIALGALKEQAFTGDIAGVSVGLGGSFEITGVDLTDAKGRRFKVAEATGKLSVWDAIFGEIHLARLTATGVDANLVKVKRPGDKGDEEDDKPASPVGVLPVVRVDSADIDGTTTVVAGAPVRFNLRIRNLDTLAGGTAVVSLAGVAGGPVVTGDATLRFAGRAPEAPASGREVLRALAPTLVVQAEAREKENGPVAARLDFSADVSGAVLKATSGGGAVNLKAGFGADDRVEVKGDWKLDRSALAVWTKAAVPEFTASGTVVAGHDFATKTTAVKLAGAGRTVAAQAGWNGPDAFAFAADFSGVSKGPWRIRNLHLDAGTSGAPTSAVSVDAGALTLYPKAAWRMETAAGEAASVKLRAFPAVWLNPLLKASGAAFVSGDFSGDLKLTGDAAGAVALNSSGGLASSPLKLLVPGRPALEGLTVKIPVSLVRAADGALTVKGSGVGLELAGKPAANAGFTWRSGASGEGELDAKLFLSPGALPADFIPGGVCKFCADTGLGVSADASVSRRADGAITVSKAHVEAVTREGVRALSATLLKPLGADAMPPVGEPVVALAFKGAPLALANPLLNGPVLGGVAESGDLVVSHTATGWRVERPAAGAQAFVRGLSWRGADGVPVLLPTDTRGSVVWENTTGGWNLSLADAAFENGKGRAVKGRFAVKSGDGIESADADLVFNLSALAASLPSLNKMRVEDGAGTLKLNYSPRGDSTVDFAVSGVRRTGVAGDYGATAAGRVALEKNGFSWNTPVVLTGPSGATKVSVTGSLSGAAGARVVDLTVHGDRLYGDDWKAFAAAKLPEPEPAAKGLSWDAETPAKTTTDKVSFWDGYTGRVAMSFDAADFAGEKIGSPQVVVNATPERLATESLAANWRGLPVTGAATLDFKTGAAKPYVLAASGSLTGVPLGKVVASVSPNAAGWIDGDFDGKFAASGEAENPGALAASVTCDANVRSRDGTIKFFKADNDTVRMSGDLAGIAGDIAGGLGKILADKTPGVSKALEGASVLQKALRSVDYKTLVLVAKRTPDGGITISDATVVNDLLKISASGVLGPSTGTGFLDRHAAVSATLSGKNIIADALRGVVGKTAVTDTSGWVSAPALQYDGPLNNVKNNLLNNLLRSVSAPFAPKRGTNGDNAPVQGDAVKAIDRILDRLPL